MNIMRKGYWGLFLLMLMSSTLMAKVEFGLQVHGGPSFGRYKNYNLKNSKLSSLGGQFISKNGGGGGVAARLWFNKFVGLSLGVEVNQGGNIRKLINKTGGTQEYIHDERLNYLVVPLCGHVGWGNERLRVFGTAGAYFGYALNGKYHITNQQNGIVLQDESGDMDFDNTYNRIDAGLRFGGGLEVFVSKNRKHGITADFTYDWGFYKVLQEDIEYKNHTYRITNSRTLIQIGYLVRFGDFEAGEKSPADKLKL